MIPSLITTRVPMQVVDLCGEDEDPEIAVEIVSG